MSNTDLIKELRALTSAGMSDCKKALEESNWDLDGAVDLIKVRGLNIASDRAGRIASEGMVVIADALRFKAMVEVNSQTDFVAQSPAFQKFASLVALDLVAAGLNGTSFQHDNEILETSRKALVSTSKENVVVRRWWIEESLRPDVRVFSYVHSNNKIGVLLTLRAPDFQLSLDQPVPWNHPDFIQLGEDLAMQVAAMNPLAVSVERLSPEDVERQRAIFETQLKELSKPQAAWAKIIEGKFRKYYSEVCLLEQESIVVPKNTVAQVIKSIETKIGGAIQVVNFIRCQMGEGIEKKQDNLAEEVNKLIVDQAYGPDVRK